ncbi:DUF4148 domain-containing protein [Burkholderia vietnamiensis]|nr:DUF4148 domain-containing protein [Burkholderia vietnamiensis]
MKATRVLSVVVLVIVPALSFADAGPGLTRTDARAEFVRLERPGYNPGRSKPRVATAQQSVRSDQNSPSKSQGDNAANMMPPDKQRSAAQKARFFNVDIYGYSQSHSAVSAYKQRRADFQADIWATSATHRE